MPARASQPFRASHTTQVTIWRDLCSGVGPERAFSQNAVLRFQLSSRIEASQTLWPLPFCRASGPNSRAMLARLLKGSMRSSPTTENPPATETFLQCLAGKLAELTLRASADRCPPQARGPTNPGVIMPRPVRALIARCKRGSHRQRFSSAPARMPRVLAGPLPTPRPFTALSPRPQAPHDAVIEADHSLLPPFDRRVAAKAGHRQAPLHECKAPGYGGVSVQEQESEKFGEQ